MDRYYSRYEPIFGAWYITDEIGSGGEGQLFRIRRVDARGREYFSALKAISVPSGGEAEIESLMAGGLSRQEAEDFFEKTITESMQEFDFLAKLKGNSHIVSYEDHEIYKRTDSFGWDILIRMEELKPLVKHSIEHPLSPREVAVMGADICRGLLFCRKYNVVHRDIKPENIFVAPSGDYKLGDFGIARIIENTQVTNLSRKGTYGYMAPEIYWGRPYGPAVDIYSLGLVMYRYLNNGRDPFMTPYPEPLERADRDNAFLKRVQNPDVPPPQNGPEDLKRIVLRAVALDAGDRYASPQEMLRDLEVFLVKNPQEDEGPADRPAVLTAEPQPKASSSRWKRLLAVLAAICVIAAGILYAQIPKKISSIEGIGETAEILYGEELAPVYTVEPDRFEDEPVTFESSDPAVFTVDEAGRLRAVSVGEAVLTLRARAYERQVAVTVIPKVTDITGVDETIWLTRGYSAELEPQLEPEEYASEPILYETADPAIATVDESGRIEAIAAGETALRISAGGFTKEFRISVSEPQPAASSSSGGSSGKSSSKKKSSSSGGGGGGGDEGYFSSSDDEFF
ncbi:MAG: protein kinase [Mogibacterium sp.]|nr:protein kinase [Mogibacterium sp.]